MYRINLYPEFAERRRGARGRLLWTALLAGAIGLESLLVIGLAVSGGLMHERAEKVRVEARALESAIQAGPAGGTDLVTAREVMAVRLRRIDWSPLLASLSSETPEDIRLDQITGRVGSKTARARMELEGHVAAGAADMPSVSQFLDALGRDRQVSRSFSDIKLGNLEAGETGRFLVVCEAARKDS